MGIRAARRQLFLVALPVAVGEFIVPLSSGRHVGFSTAGSTAFRVRLYAETEPISSPMVAPDDADAPYRVVESLNGRGIASSFGSILVNASASIALLDSKGFLLTASQPLMNEAVLELSTNSGKLYGRGAGPDDAMQLAAASSHPRIRNRASYVPYYYTADGYAALGVTNVTTVEKGLGDSTAYLSATYRSDGHRIAWEYAGAFELYLMPAATLAVGTRAYFGLCGAPRVPPRFAFGFFASRWGWRDRAEVEDTLSEFRAGQYPIDAYIADFEWFAPLPDYLLPSTGTDWYRDFEFREKLFPSPQHDLAQDASEKNVRFGGIRKTRLGNSDNLAFARRNGWIQSGGFRDAGLLVHTILALAFVLLMFLAVCSCLLACVPRRRWAAARDGSAFACTPRAQETLSRESTEVGEEEVNRQSPLLAEDSVSTSGSQLDTHQQAPARCCPRTAYCCLAIVSTFLVVAYLIFLLIFWLDRNLDFSQPAVREWYAAQTESYIRTGVSFWWNDEGENAYFQYHWWNVAEILALRKVSASTRFYSLNRAFTPGMARLGATVWTGDVDASWEDLGKTPGIMLNWGLAGAPYVACDIGGFNGQTNAQLLVRWYQVGVFMPSMRVHSVWYATPHWPFLWGDEAANAMRQALNLRYRLVPYHYSLAHSMFSQRDLWIRPLPMDFPLDDIAASIATQWMDGALLVAPVLRADSQATTYLPAGHWYTFNSSVSYRGAQWINRTASLDEVPVFVRAGGVVPLAPLMQHTFQLPGGALEVHVYAGADGVFDFAEDDGETTQYENGDVRKTHIKWDDGRRVLSWSMYGQPSGDWHVFTHLFATLFDSSGARRSVVQPFERSGHIAFSV